MLEWLFLFLIIGFFLSAYIVSFYSLAVYIDPDDIVTLFPGISRKNREALKKLADDPRAFMQIATVYKSFALIVITVLTTYILQSVTRRYDLSFLYVYPVGLVLVWFSQIFWVEYFARRAARRAYKSSMPRHLWLITLIYFIFFPVVSAYRKALSRINKEEQVSEKDKEDIVERAIETLAEQAGISEAIVEEDEKEMIGQIFLLDETVVREIMVPRIDIVGIEKSMSFVDIQKLVLQHGYSRYPVYDESIDRILGIVYVKDLFNRMPERGEEFVIKNYLRKPYYVPESKVIGQLLREFQLKKFHIAVAVDEYGGVAGLVTLEDILEEIFGEIQDEHDSEEAEFKKIAANTYLVDAGLLVEELQDYLDTDYPQEDYDTVGGLIYDLVGSVPREGHKIRWHNLVFDVEKVEGQRIMKVKVHKK
ncbi:MAG: HlyC/CorC family transporter [candidate division Zixibacteria bacterium]|nr:HlyC/CorC family transporter [candidate division Zixibacteria bacterium]